jgi:hypothetical protein
MPTGTVAVIVCQRRAEIWYLANEQHGIAELVQPIVVQLQLRAQVLQQHIAGKRPHQLVVTLTALMHSSHDRIHHPKVRVGIDSLRGEARARRESAGLRGCVLEGAAHAGAHGDNPSPTFPGPRDRSYRRFRQVVRLIQRKPGIELRVAGGGDPGGVGQGGKADSACRKLCEQGPVEHKARRGRLERRRNRGHPGPHIPQRERLLHVCVLDRLAVPSDAVPDHVRRPREAKPDQAAVSQ